MIHRNGPFGTRPATKDSRGGEAAKDAIDRHAAELCKAIWDGGMGPTQDVVAAAMRKVRAEALEEAGVKAQSLKQFFYGDYRTYNDAFDGATEAIRALKGQP